MAVSFSLNTDLCDCEKSNLCDPHDKYVIIGDLRIIENKKLRKLLTKGPNYREQQKYKFQESLFWYWSSIRNLYWKDVYKKQIRDIKTCTLERINFNYRKRKKLRNLNRKYNPYKQNQYYAVLISNHNWKNYTNIFIIATIDKAASNFTFICKKYYIS